LTRFVHVAEVDQIPQDGGFVAVVGGREIAIFRCDGEYLAVENTCPHRGGPVAEGEFEDGIVSCPWHAWPFDVRTGECTINSAAKLETYEVEVEEGIIWVKV
jgi:NAD(P)H-dependent nitrite reductase small subunit